MRILLVEDDPTTSRSIELMLTHANLNVYCTDMGEDGIDLAKLYDYDLILLDLNLPDMSGHEVLRQVRQARVETPILILSARDDQRQKVIALDKGADDYLTKPFGIEELMARVRVALRHGARISKTVDPVIENGGLIIDLARRQVSRDGAEVRLTATEFKMLAYLAGHADRVLTHHAILEAVWGMEYTDQVEYLRVYMRQLRAKLEADPHHPVMLLTEPGVGYRFALL